MTAPHSRVLARAACWWHSKLLQLFDSATHLVGIYPKETTQKNWTSRYTEMFKKSRVSNIIRKAGNSLNELVKYIIVYYDVATKIFKRY